MMIVARWLEWPRSRHMNSSYWDDDSLDRYSVAPHHGMWNTFHNKNGIGVVTSGPGKSAWKPWGLSHISWVQGNEVQSVWEDLLVPLLLGHVSSQMWLEVSYWQPMLSLLLGTKAGKHQMSHLNIKKIYCNYSVLLKKNYVTFHFTKYVKGWKCKILLLTK